MNVKASQGIRIDVRKPLAAQPDLGHNRWHPEIRPVLSVEPGTVVSVDVRDGMDGQIRPGVDVADLPALLGVNGGRNLPLTGPIEVIGAEPGDVLEVELLDLEPAPIGWTGIFPDFTVLPDRLQSYLVFWDIADGYARTPSIPGVAIPARPFLGVAGVAPSLERVKAATRRELDLAERTGAPLKFPEAHSFVPADRRIGAEALRPETPRENGGNMDSKLLTTGSQLLLPVDVPGALLSVGDAHFSQGDGESLSSAIEISGRATLQIGLRKRADLKWAPTLPAVEVADLADHAIGGPYVVTTGIPVDAEGRNELLDLTLALRRALEEMLEYLTVARGYSTEQAAVIIGVAADIRVSAVVSAPNALVSVLLPLGIFE